MINQNPVLFAYRFDVVGKASKIEDSEISKNCNQGELLWVHLDCNSRAAKQWLQSLPSHLDHIAIDALTAEETRPRMTEFDDGLLAILRDISLDNKFAPQDMASIRIWVSQHFVITGQKRSAKSIFYLQDAIDPLEEDKEIAKIIRNPGEFLYNLVSQIILNTAYPLSILGNKIDDLEREIINNYQSKFREQILSTRMQSITFRRYLIPQKEAIAKLRHAEKEVVDHLTKRYLQENLDQISIILEETEEILGRSQILNDELNTALNAKLNRNMFKMSLITIIFMPLTFITGVFGMNFSQIPGIDRKDGFYLCIISMALIALTQLVFFKKRDWL